MIHGTQPRLFNSLGREMIDFRPADDSVRIYTCGMTVYADAHLGNLRPYVFSDTLSRMLKWKGLSVTSVVNITDIGHTVGDGDLGEDKVEVTARAQSASVSDVTQHYTAVFFRDLARVNVMPQTYNPPASDYVPQMIEFARVLERRGFTYRLESGLYFDTAKSQGYGKLALKPSGGRHPDVHRLETVVGKRSPADFAIWRSEHGPQKRLVHWDSPWGAGVPGWHLECSVMSIELLGEHFDIHTGGVDHREIHHVNEIAQSEAYIGDGRDWVPLWMHNEFVLLGNHKIAKSSGRMPILEDLIDAGYHPLSYRYFLLNAHYRSQLDLTETGLRAALAGFRRLISRVAQLGPLPETSSRDMAAAELTSPAAAEALDAIDSAIADDLNTPRVLAEVYRILRLEAVSDYERAVLVATAEQLLGIGLGVLTPDEITLATRLAMPGDFIDGLVEARAAARRARDWTEADRIRDQLTAIGVRVLDTADGSRWEPSITEASWGVP
jgi:cysteinyl-tRNA synthetase